MKIDIVDKIVEQDIFTHRICKIIYSLAFENYLKEKLSFLRKSYNVYQIKDLFLSNENIKNSSRFKEWGIGIIKNLLGLLPSYGSYLTIIFSISDTVSFLKKSDLEKIKEKLQLKEKPKKKYRKIKNIFIVNNASYLNEEEIKKVRFIQTLIEKKYIVNTLLIICEPLDFDSVLFSVDHKDAEYKLCLDNNFLQNNLGVSLDEKQLELIEFLGIEYVEQIRNLNNDALLNNDVIIKKLIANMLHKAGYNEDENLLDFLKLCSLLFETFSHEDIENVSGIKNICCEEELKKTMESKLFEKSLYEEYRFFVKYVRKYYQENAKFYSSKIKKKILDYLKRKYPKNYTDLALANIIANDKYNEKISLCIKAIYYDKNISTIYKLSEIKCYISESKNKILAGIFKLNDIYNSLDYLQTDAKNLCMKSFYGLTDLAFLSIEDRLICLSIIAKVSYELMDQTFLLEIDTLYRKLLGDLKISTTYNKYTSFILDYIVFSTCIENNFETSHVVQSLLPYLQKSDLSLENKIKYSRLGNAIFIEDYSKGLELTKKAYNLSGDYILEHKYAAINYSCSLGMCGDYKTAEITLLNEFTEAFFNRNAISISATNNYVIVAYLNRSHDSKWMMKKLLTLYKKIGGITFSDQQIVCNNLLAAYIAENRISNRSKIQELSKYISENEEDLYHLFYMRQNMMIYHFLNNDHVSFKHERSICSVPKLLSPYSDFFEAKTDFMEENFNKNWSIQQLQEELITWGEKYHEKNYSLYKNSLLFGFIERWFE